MAKQVVACLDVWAPNVRQVVRDNAPPDFDLHFADTYDEAEQMGLVRGCDLILVGGATLNGAMIEAALPRLKFIQKWGIGVDKIDVEAARRLGVPLAITGGANAVPVAELAVALMLAVYRRIPYADRKTRAGEWIKPQMRGMCYMIDGKTVGLLGFGAIARMVARRLAGFDCRVVYYDVNRADHITERALNARWVPLEELIAKSDILSVHVPLTKHTANIIDAAAIARMKDGAIIVNTARGGIVDEVALHAALVSGKLRGAGIDTFAEEPPPKDHPLLALENVVVTPHAGGGVFDNVDNVAKHAIGNMMKVLSGAALAPQDVVVPVEGVTVARWSPICDTHAHIFLRDLPLVAGATHRPDRDYATAEYLAQLDAEGVTYGVIAAPSFLGTYNDYMTRELRAHRRLRGTAILDPSTDPYAMRAMDAEGVVGIRFSLRRYADIPDLAAPDWQRLLRRVRDLDWHVHILAEPERLRALLPILVESGVKLVIDHFGHPSTPTGEGCPAFEGVLRALGNGRTWVKLSGPYRTPGMDAKAVAARLLREGGAERLLWGSDCPWTAHEGRFTYRDCIAWFEDWIPDAATREAIGQSALKLYRFA